MAVTTIPTAGIADGAVDTNQLADDAVTIAKATGFGKVLQIQKDEFVGSNSNSSSTFADVQTVTVTPVAQNSKYLIRLSGGYIYNVSDKYMAVRVQVKENTGSYANIDSANDKAWATNHGTNSSYLTAPHSWEFLYTPSNTSTLTSIAFKTQFASINTSGAVQYNAGAFFSSTLEGGCLFSVMEIGA
jgi:hypothetical protein